MKKQLIHPTRKGALIAEVRYGDHEHMRATKIGQHWWFRVRLGKSNMIKCDCGGEVEYRPAELTYMDSWGGCSHIVALFKGNVTSDPKMKTVDGDYRVSWGPGQTEAHFFTRLTVLGERLFHWRWTTLKWKD